MFDILWNLIAFIVALGVLVTIHEYGHFWVARKLGVKVLTFSFGFGKPLLQKVGKDGVRYVIAAFPLGGYIEMLDERVHSDDMSEEDKAFAFNRQSLWVRTAIVLAGPLANFVLAIVLYWWMFMLGTPGLLPVVAEVPENTIAYQAGLQKDDLILSVDGEAIVTTQDLVEGLVKRLGEKSRILLTVQRDGFSQPKTISLDIKSWQVDDEKPKIMQSLGIYHPLIDPSTQIGEVAAGAAADEAGIQSGDIVISVNDMVVTNWREMEKIIRAMPNQPTNIQVDRNGELMNLSVVIGSQDDKGKVGRLGVGAKSIESAPYIITQKVGVFDAFILSIETAYKKILLTARLFKKLLVGDISHKSISGPLSIAEGAGTSASFGLIAFLGFLAMISVNLGFINLLPVPMLDGGHLLFFAIEAIKGKPLTQKMQEFALQIGMMLVFLLMAIAFYNDIVIH